MKALKIISLIILLPLIYILSYKISLLHTSNKINEENYNPIDRIIGQTVSDFIIFDKDGTPFSFYDIINKDVNEEKLLIVFYSFACSTCLSEAHEWKQFKEEMKAIEMMGIAFDITGEDLSNFEERTNIGFTNWISAKETVLKLNINVWPTYYLIDSQSMKIINAYRGDGFTNNINEKFTNATY